MVRNEDVAMTRFLDQAASALAVQVPPVAAHLVLQRNARQPGNPIAQPKKGACQACGTILIPGVTSKMSGEKSDSRDAKKYQRKTAKASSTTEQQPKQEWIRIECLACHRYERFEKGSSGIQADQRHTKPAEYVQPGRTLVSEKPVSANKSSKERAKARKRGGLQALLDISKQNADLNTGLRLDLMDIMKQD